MKIANAFKINKLSIFAAVLLLFLVSCVEQETVFFDNKTDDADPAPVIEEADLSSASKNKTTDGGAAADILGPNACNLDSECGGETIDKARCWQRTVYTTFNQSSCVAGRCKTTQYEAITQECNSETEACMAGQCIPKPRCYQRGETSIYSYSEVSDGLGNKYGNYCESNTTLVQFFCNPEVIEKIFNETKACADGCRNGKCNPETVE